MSNVDYASFGLMTPQGQQMLQARAAAGGGLPPDLVQYLEATGEINRPHWRRLLSGDNPIGAGVYGWRGEDTPMRTTQGQRPVFGQRPAMGPPSVVGFEQGEVPVSSGFGGPRTVNRPDGSTMEVGGGTMGVPRAQVRAATYYEGDADVEYARMSPEQRARTKQLMRDVGLLNENAGGVGGSWDSQAFSAFNEVLRVSNAQGTSWRVTISGMRDYIRTHPEEGPQKQGPVLPAFVADVSNPMDLRKVFEQVATRITGSKVDEAQVEGFVRAYQQQQIAQQRAAFDATYSMTDENGVGAGGIVTDAPNPEVAAEEMVRQANPAAAGGTDIANVFGSLMEILGGAGSG